MFHTKALSLKEQIDQRKHTNEHRKRWKIILMSYVQCRWNAPHPQHFTNVSHAYKFYNFSFIVIVWIFRYSWNLNRPDSLMIIPSNSIVILLHSNKWIINHRKSCHAPNHSTTLAWKIHFQYVSANGPTVTFHKPRALSQTRPLLNRWYYAREEGKYWNINKMFFGQCSIMVYGAAHCEDWQAHWVATS